MVEILCAELELTAQLAADCRQAVQGRRLFTSSSGICPDLKPLALNVLVQEGMEDGWTYAAPPRHAYAASSRTDYFLSRPSLSTSQQRL
jgi:hypothetical protein